VTVHAEDGTHTHVLADGTVVTHAHHHEDGHEHHHAHDHGHDHSHALAHGHEHSHAHAHGTVRHDPTAIDVEVQILAKNDRLAERNRGWFLGRDVVALNLMSSPGSGKTTLLEKTLARMPERSAVLEGDQETDADAARIRATGARVVQINTGQGCHLEADMVWHGLQHLALEPASNLFIENVGNLVCPALFDLGESAKVVLFSVTEGEDKPLKYPHMFRTADLVILTKTDLLPYLDFDRPKALDAIRAVNATADVLEVSSKTGDGMDAWLRWIEARRPSKTGSDSRVEPQYR
jgi:hydrogenase nickel incorporation protein HypB